METTLARSEVHEREISIESQVPAVRFDLEDQQWLMDFCPEIALVGTERLAGIVERGSRPLNFPSHDDDARVDTMMARGELFDILGFPEGSYVRNALEKRGKCAPLPPTDRVLESIYTMSTEGLQARKIVDKVPASVWFSSEDIITKLEGLSNLGLAAVKIVNRQPVMLTLRTENVAQTIETLGELGLNGPAIVNKQPNVPCNADKKIAMNVKFAQRVLRLWGLSEDESNRFIEDNAQLISMAKRNLRARARIISSTHCIDKDSIGNGVISIPTESLLAARTETDVTEELFKKARVHKRNFRTAKDRRGHVEGLLDDASVRDRLGAKVVHAYMQYATVH